MLAAIGLAPGQRVQAVAVLHARGHNRHGGLNAVRVRQRHALALPHVFRSTMPARPGAKPARPCRPSGPRLMLFHEPLFLFFPGDSSWPT